MMKKGGNFFEEHTEKIVLAIVGLVCVVLLITRVLFSPNSVEYNDKKFGPGIIDNYILSNDARDLEDNLNRKPEQSAQPDQSRVDDLIDLVDSAITDVNIGFYPPQPSYLYASGEIIDDRVYSIPQIGEVSDVVVEHIRAVAYIPTKEIDEKNVYDNTGSEPNDIDFVTVEAKFNVTELAENFYESFAGKNIPEEWCDPSLAKPIFAAVQLQRQERLADGSWSGWHIVPRIRIDARRQMFEVVENVGDLPAGGMKVRLLQYGEGQVKADLLQPAAYQIASSKEEWFPPSLHKEFVKYQKSIKDKERREARAAEREELEREREASRLARSSRTVRTGILPGARTDGGFGEPEDPLSGGLSRRSSAGTRRSRRDERVPSEQENRDISRSKPPFDINNELGRILITGKTDFTGMSEPLIFWAHDDMVEPEKSYRYRIRLGVFNPIAGTNQLNEQDKLLKDKVILWSKFSDVTETVTIPGMLYFFPTDIQEATRIVTVTVCRYVLDYWYSRDFMVKQGEVIGNVVALESVEEEENITVPETVDYSTGAILVDVIPVNDWSGGKNLRARRYFDMLYSFDMANIEHIPVKSRYWSGELQTKFKEIETIKKEPKEPLRSWGSRQGERGRFIPRLEFEGLGEDE